jgi:hypothetical protein
VVARGVRLLGWSGLLLPHTRHNNLLDALEQGVFVSALSTLVFLTTMASALAVGPTTGLTKSDLGKPKSVVLSVLSSAGLEARSIPREKIEGDFYSVYKGSHFVGEVHFCDDGTMTGFSEEVPGDINTFVQMSASLNKKYGDGSFVSTNIGMNAGQFEVLTVQWTRPDDHLTLSYQVPNGHFSEKLTVGHGDSRKCWKPAKLHSPTG